MNLPFQWMAQREHSRGAAKETVLVDTRFSSSAASAFQMFQVESNNFDKNPPFAIGSMYGIVTFIWLICMVYHTWKFDMYHITMED